MNIPIQYVAIFCVFALIWLLVWAFRAKKPRFFNDPPTVGWSIEERMIGTMNLLTYPIGLPEILTGDTTSLSLLVEQEIPSEIEVPADYSPNFTVPVDSIAATSANIEVVQGANVTVIAQATDDAGNVGQSPALVFEAQDTLPPQFAGPPVVGNPISEEIVDTSGGTEPTTPPQ